MTTTILKIVAVVLGFLVLIAFYSTAGPLFHLYRVTVTGDSEVVREQDVRAGLAQSGSMSLIHGDFTALVNNIAALPLVRNVTVHKQMPHGLVLEVTARKAYARSSDGGLVDSNGEWYPADSTHKLPIFAMSRSQMPHAVEFHADANSQLTNYGIGINQVHHTDDGWRLYLSNGWILLLGDSKIGTRLQNFITTLPDLQTGLAGTGNFRFDLRYPHGMALAGLRIQEEKDG